MAVFRIYVEKKAPYAVEAGHLCREINEILGIREVTGVRVLNRYDVEGIDDRLFLSCGPIVFYEPQLDDHFDSLPEDGDALFAVEYLPGQYDQRAASCEECIQFVSEGERPTVRTAKIYLLYGKLSDETVERIKRHVINPVEAREASLERPQSLRQKYETPENVPVLHGFTAMRQQDVSAFVKQYGLAMDADDLEFCRQYFLSEKRDPTLTEIRMIDTYWSDHCRHTTFLTAIDDVKILKPQVEEAFQTYLSLRKTVHGEKDKPISLMDMATIGGKYLNKIGRTPNIDVSEEINACSIEIQVDVDGQSEPWLLMFKNETHNHPTEIEPFGGAATCIGGAIRDPLSGRTYVYQAMRVTGAADPALPIEKTMKGKLPQRKLVTTAAHGYSSYGNQIGLATGLVDEIYHDGYAAKRMEIGAVLGAAPKKHIRRECPAPGDAVVLLGGRTGRDGCGGATGSSKSHKVESIETCGAEVQKGNAPVERKLQRLFRDEKVTRLIKRCNDFGAGGVSVAVGELADGLQIDLDQVPKKYEGLDGTELAISESQERMAVVVARQDVDAFIAYANAENLEATCVAAVTEEPRLVMNWKGQRIVDLSRDFLNSNGAQKHAGAKIPDASLKPLAIPGTSLLEKFSHMAGDLNVCGKKGLSEMFDSTIGAATVMMPFGGKQQLTPVQAMVAKLPVLKGTTQTCSGMAYGFHPEVMAQSPFDGAYLAVVESVAKLVAAGFDHQAAYLTFQEYFERMTDDPASWGKPMAALLGALKAQVDLGIASIGGKDSMSGTFEDLSVPPTLVSFAVTHGKTGDMVSPEFKAAGHPVILLSADPYDKDALLKVFQTASRLMREKKAVSGWALGLYGIAEGLFKMGLGNRIGFTVDAGFTQDLFGWSFGSILLEVTEPVLEGMLVGTTQSAYHFAMNGETVSLDAIQAIYERRLETVFPYRGNEGETVKSVRFEASSWPKPALLTQKPLAFIPVFPGTNCEIDTQRALERAGGQAELLVINNLSPKSITQSIQKAEEIIRRSQMIILPGGFSGGDEPDGSGKFITAFFRNPLMKDAVHDLLKQRGGLMLGICNGFQALIKLGLVPYGEIVDTDIDCATLTYNTIGRHQSMLVNTRIASNRSPWLQLTQPGEVHTIAISHGEGRFVAPKALINQLIQNGQIAAQYVDPNGQASMDLRYNPNASYLAVEAITSPDGRVLGKMGHSERSGEGLYQNVPGNKHQPLFEGGVRYFQ